MNIFFDVLHTERNKHCSVIKLLPINSNEPRQHSTQLLIFYLEICHNILQNYIFGSVLYEGATWCLRLRKQHLFGNTEEWFRTSVRSGKWKIIPNNCSQMYWRCAMSCCSIKPIFTDFVTFTTTITRKKSNWD